MQTEPEYYLGSGDTYLQFEWIKDTKSFGMTPERLLHDHCPLKDSGHKRGSTVVLRGKVPFQVAKDEIIEFVKQQKEEIFISDIIHDLRLDLDLVLEILEELYDEGYIDRTD